MNNIKNKEFYQSLFHFADDSYLTITSMNERV
jgi:hypothetical protein